MRSFVVLLILLTIFTQESFACRPAQNYKHPTPEENFKAADHVVIGRVIDSSGTGFSRKIRLKIVEALKGHSVRELKFEVGASTCDHVGYAALPGVLCLFYIKDGHSLSGFKGNSQCHEGDPRDEKKSIEKWKLRK